MAPSKKLSTHPLKFLLNFHNIYPIFQQQQQQTVQLVSGSAVSPQPQSGTQVITLTPEQYAQLAQQQQQAGVGVLIG